MINSTRNSIHTNVILPIRTITTMITRIIIEIIWADGSAGRFCIHVMGGSTAARGNLFVLSAPRKNDIALPAEVAQDSPEGAVVVVPGQVSSCCGCWIIWVVVKIMVPFWIPITIRHLIFRVAKQRGTIIYFDNHPYRNYYRRAFFHSLLFAPKPPSCGLAFVARKSCTRGKGVSLTIVRGPWRPEDAWRFRV